MTTSTINIDRIPKIIATPSQAVEYKFSCKPIGSFGGQQIQKRPKYQRIKIQTPKQQHINEPTTIPATIAGPIEQVEVQPLPPGAH